MVAWLPDGQAAPSFAWIPKAVFVLALLVVVAGVLGWPYRGEAILRGTPPRRAASLADGLVTAGLPGSYILAALGLVGLLEKWRLSTGMLRQQLKLVLLGVIVAVATNIVAAIVPAVSAVRLAGFVVMLVSIGVAVFRYRLFDIDRLIKGTILYGFLTAALLAVVATAGVLAGSTYRLGTGASVAPHPSPPRSPSSCFDRCRDGSRTTSIGCSTVEVGTPPVASGTSPPARGPSRPSQEPCRHFSARSSTTPALSSATGLSTRPRRPMGRPVVGTPDGVVLDVVSLGSGEAVVAHGPRTAGDGNRLRRVLEESVVAFEHGSVQADLERQLAALRDFARPPHRRRRHRAASHRA